VFALAAAENCVYFGGSFNMIVPNRGDGPMLARFAARLCELGSSGGGEAGLEAVDSFDTVGPIRALASADGHLA